MPPPPTSTDFHHPPPSSTHEHPKAALAKRAATPRDAVAATVGWFMLSGLLPDVGHAPNIKIGDRGMRPGGGFTMNISDEFQQRAGELK